jgi:hypothetical protein
MKITTLIWIIGSVFLSNVPAHAQNYADRYAHCISTHLTWTGEDCRWVAKGKFWEGMSAAQREAAEAAAKEIDAETARAKKKAKPNAPSSVPVSAPIGSARANAGADVGAASSGLWAAVLLFLGACLYLLPGIVGQNRHHHQRTAIWVLNIFLGWTVLGWIAALVWASTATGGQQRV